MEAEDIKNKTFKTRLRGYDKAEVDSFLQQLAEQLDQMDAANQYVQQELYNANQTLDAFHEKEDSLNRALVVAQQAADHLRTEAIQEADHIVEKAQDAAQQLLSEAAKRATHIQEETELLKDTSRTYVHQMHGLVLATKDALEDEHWQQLFAEEPIDPVETPTLDAVLKDEALPLSDGAAEAHYDAFHDAEDKEKKQEQFFAKHEQQAPERAADADANVADAASADDTTEGTATDAE